MYFVYSCSRAAFHEADFARNPAKYGYSPPLPAVRCTCMGDGGPIDDMTVPHMFHADSGTERTGKNVQGHEVIQHSKQSAVKGTTDLNDNPRTSSSTMCSKGTGAGTGTETVLSNPTADDAVQWDRRKSGDRCGAKF